MLDDQVIKCSERIPVIQCQVIQVPRSLDSSCWHWGILAFFQHMFYGQLKKLFRISGDSLLANHHPRQGTFGKKQIQTWDKNMVESSFLGLNHLQHIFNYVATVSKPISNTRLKGAVLFAKLHRFHPAPPVPNDLPLPLQAAPAARSANRQKSPRTLSPTAPWLWWSWANYKQN